MQNEDAEIVNQEMYDVSKSHHAAPLRDGADVHLRYRNNRSSRSPSLSGRTRWTTYVFASAAHRVSIGSELTRAPQQLPMLFKKDPRELSRRADTTRPYADVWPTFSEHSPPSLAVHLHSAFVPPRTPKKSSLPPSRLLICG